MIEIGIDPVAFTVGSFPVKWNTIIEVLALVLALPLYFFQARRLGITRGHALWLCALFAVAGFIGGRLLLLIERLIFVHSIGIIGSTARMPGALLGTIAVVLIYAALAKRSVWQLLDIGALSLYLFIGVYRIGCVLNGCCYGIDCDLPWAVVYTSPQALAPPLIPIHPTQLYHLLWTALVWIAVMVLQRRPHIPGVPALIAIILYSLGDFAIRFFRADEPVLLGWLSLSQVVDLLQLPIAAYFLIVRWKAPRSEPGI